MKNVWGRREGILRRKAAVGIILGIVVVGVLAAVSVAIRFNHAVHAAAPGDVEQAPPAVTEPVTAPATHLNILVLGSDARTKDDPGRSDSIILVGLDTVAHTITLMSIPRDTRVTIPGHGVGKINATTNRDVYADGGIPLLKKTIQGLIPGITVDYYVRTNFAGFVKIIDAVGGVTIDVEERMLYRTSDTTIDLQPGLQHLNGTKALEYMRFRDDGVGDFGSWGGEEHGRVARQKKLLKAVIAQTTDLRNAWRLPKLVAAVGDAVTTDLPTTQMVQLGLAFKDATDKDVTTVVFPGIPKWVDGVSYVVPYTGPMAEKVAPLFRESPAPVDNPSAAAPGT
ncbi:MAG TPA: LCP family protein [Candidatus Cryosericum sp.]|nr:LCP family protein [Candidatus Cryosericum sp.]